MAAHHSLNERRIIAKMLHRKTTVAKLALHLGRRRNFWHNLRSRDGCGMLAGQRPYLTAGHVR